MADFYIDPENGNDSNDGSLATPFRTITGATAAKGVVAGHTIGIAKTPDPVSTGISASWTNKSATLNLASALTLTVDDCESAWTQSANVTASTSTARKQGDYACQLAIASGFTTGKVAYKTTASTDYSSYTHLTFWFHNSAALLAGRLKLCLCSDTTGDTIVDTFNIPAIPSTNNYVGFTIAKDGGGALGASIQSVALYADIDPGTITVLLDNIEATAGIGLDCCVSKDSGLDGDFYCVRSIIGTELVLSGNTNTYANTASQGYYGDTETVTLYYFRPTKIDMNVSASVSKDTVQLSGANGSLLTYQGGYNMSTGAKDGYTILSGQNSQGVGISINSKDYIEIKDIGLINYYNSFDTTGSFCELDILNVQGLGWANWSIGLRNDIKIRKANLIISAGSFNRRMINAIRSNIEIVESNSCTLAGGVELQNCYSCNLTVGSSCNGAKEGITINGGSNNKLYLDKVCDNGTYAVYSRTGNSADYKIYNLEASDNSSGSFYLAYYLGTLHLYNCIIDDAVQFVGLTDNYNQRVHIQDYDQIAGNCRTYTDGGLIQNTDSVRYVASGTSVQLSPTSTNRDSSYPLQLEDEQILFAVRSGVEYRLSVWGRKDNLGLTCGLKIPGGQMTSYPNDLTAEVSAADTWEQLSIDFTPDDDGVIEVTFYAYGGTAYSAYFQVMNFEPI